MLLAAYPALTRGGGLELPVTYPKPTTRKIVVKQELWRGFSCPACRALPGADCLHRQDTKTGLRGTIRPPHPRRIDRAIVEDWYQRCQEWKLSPAGIAREAARQREQAKEARRNQRRVDNATKQEAKKQAAIVIRKQLAAEQRALLQSDGITMRERVLSALIRIGGEGSAWRVAQELQLEGTLLTAVHSGLLACVKRGDVTREIVPSFVPSHSFSRGTSSVYRVVFR